MCGRFVSTSSPERIASYFGAEVAVETLGENYNVAPTQDVYAVVAGEDGVKRVQAFHWGLIPSWAKDRKIGSRMINARSETLAEKPAFRVLFAKRRCLIPMDGFYEWKPGAADGPLNAKGQPLKQPMYIHRIDGEPLAVAGLWTVWKDPAAPAHPADPVDPAHPADPVDPAHPAHPAHPAGSVDPAHRLLHSATVITTSANDMVRPVHDRMPVIVPPSRWAEWLDPSNHDVDTLAEVFVPGDNGILTMHPVSTDVNDVRNNRPDLLD